MNRMVARSWVRALKSGKYVQGMGRLVDDAGRRCCLGVLQDLYERKVKDADVVKTSTWYLSAGCMQWASISTSSGSYDNNKSLSYANDCEKKSFPEIAEIITANVENL